VGLDALSIMGLQKGATNELQEYTADSVDEVAEGALRRAGREVTLVFTELACS